MQASAVAQGQSKDEPNGTGIVQNGPKTVEIHQGKPKW